MKKYILFVGLLAIVLIALTACYDVVGNVGLGDITWQEAYAEILNNHAQQPATTADITAAEWRFMLHDINQYGTPQLFLVRYYDGLVNFHTVYSFEYGEAILLKSAFNMTSLFKGGMYVAPGGTGVIRYLTTDIVSHYDKLELFGASLSRAVNGDAVPSVDSFRINSFPVSQEEFEDIFGRRDEWVWLAMHEITEGNIRDVVFLIDFAVV